LRSSSPNQPAKLGSSEENVIVNDSSKVHRILQLKIRAPAADITQLLTFAKANIPFYQVLGGKSFRFLRNVDDPAQFIVMIDYETHQAIELNRHSVASDPTIRTFLQGWRAMLGGAIEIDVYEDATDAA